MFYLLNKKSGISSFKAIQLFAKSFKEIKKIGHTGTLDPLASGLLLIATNDDTKLIPYVDKGFKTYKVNLELGKTSDTFDIDGKTQKSKIKIPLKEEIEKVVMGFIGKQNQVPPIFSAKKIKGQRSYDLARKGKKFTLKPVQIEIKNISKLKIKLPYVEFEVIVSRGTYIRSLVNDIGKKLHCGAVMTKLVRTKIGSLSTKRTFRKISPFKILEIDSIGLNKNEISTLLQGKQISKTHNNGTFALKYKKEILGIAEVYNDKVKPKKLFGNKMKKEGF